MGRNKIEIKKIDELKDRRVFHKIIKSFFFKVTFNKRKRGLLKKAAEIALLCDIKLALVFTDLG